MSFNIYFCGLSTVNVIKKVTRLSLISKPQQIKYLFTLWLLYFNLKFNYSHEIYYAEKETKFNYQITQ